MKNVKVDFFVIGAARSGTTSLYNYLIQHPRVFLPNIKELNYFSKVESNQYQDYKKPNKKVHYHTKIIQSEKLYHQLFAEAKSDQLKGDISPSYIWAPDTAKRIFEHNPNARIIVSLRNPVERAYSHYVMNVSVGYDTNQTFEHALNATKQRVWGGGNLYLEWSSYFEGLKSYFELFKRENIKVLVFEDWVKEKEENLKEIFNFLNIEADVNIRLEEQFNQKVGYKNIKTLNFLRSKYIRTWVDAVLPQKAKEVLKGALFQKEEVQNRVDPVLMEQLKDHFREEVKQLESLTELPLIEKWGF